MEIFLIMLAIVAFLAVVVVASFQHNKNQNADSSPTPEPTPTPLWDASAVEQEQVQQPAAPAVVIYADHIRIRSICPGCDGENDTGTAFCRICGERL